MRSSSVSTRRAPQVHPERIGTNRPIEQSDTDLHTVCSITERDSRRLDYRWVAETAKIRLDGEKSTWAESVEADDLGSTCRSLQADVPLTSAVSAVE